MLLLEKEGGDTMITNNRNQTYLRPPPPPRKLKMGLCCLIFLFSCSLRLSTEKRPSAVFHSKKWLFLLTGLLERSCSSLRRFRLLVSPM